MRLFLAVDVNDAVRAEMRRLRRAMESALTGSGRAPRVTWVSPDVAHVTLRFIGEVGDEEAAALTSTLEAPFETRAFTMAWHGLGAFPGGRAPRTLWMRVTDGSQTLAQLAREVAARVSPIVGPGEERPFRGHLTLGRVRDVDRGIDWREILAAVVCQPVPHTVDAVTLYRSHLSPRGPTYTAVKRAALA
jgi:2'-5' RNA ligase